MSRRKAWVLVLVVVWLACLAGAFRVDRTVYRDVAGPVAEKTGFKPWRFGRPEGGHSALLMEALLLFKRMGHFFFVLVISGTMVAFQRARWRQMLLLWICVAGSAAVGQGFLKPTIAKLRPDGPLTAERAAEIVEAEGDDAVVRHGGEYRNTGRVEFRGLFAGYRGLSATTFPSGHSALAFATAAVLVAWGARRLPNVRPASWRSACQRLTVGLLALQSAAGVVPQTATTKKGSYETSG